MKKVLPYLLNRRMSLGSFIRVCGYFTGHTRVNNGYGCLHPENEEQYEGDAIPRCYTFSCPLAYEHDPDKDDDVVTHRRTQELAPLPVPHDGCWHH